MSGFSPQPRPPFGQKAPPVPRLPTAEGTRLIVLNFYKAQLVEAQARLAQAQKDVDWHAANVEAYSK